MATASADDLARLRHTLLEQRRSWVDLPDGKRRLRLLRPVETKFHELAHGVTVEELCKHVDGWQGFTAADIVGAAGGDDVLPFDQALFSEWAADNAAVVKVAAEALLDVVRAFLAARQETAKN